MPDHSQDLSKQLQNLQAEANRLEQTALHKSNEIAASQKKLDELEQEFAARTELLLKGQKERVAQQRVELELDISDLRETKKGLTQLISELEKTSEDLSAEVALIKDVLAQQRLDSKTLAAEIEDSTKRATTASAHADAQMSRSLELEQAVVRLEGQKTGLEMDVSALINKRLDLERAIADLDTIYAEKTAQKEQGILALEERLRELATEIEQHEETMRIERDDLATTRKALEAQDLNLRIREEKVAVGEGKLVRHSNLLNL